MTDRGTAPVALSGAGFRRPLVKWADACDIAGARAEEHGPRRVTEAPT